MVKAGDWVTVPNFPQVGLVKRVSLKHGWADVNWKSHVKRMPINSLTVEHTIQMGTWTVTDLTRQKELSSQ